MLPVEALGGGPPQALEVTGSMSEDRGIYPRNPHYGSGVYRRRIRLAAGVGAVVGELEDCNHGFRVAVSHDGERVTAIDGEALRVPYNTCPEALGNLRRLVRTPLGLSARELNAIADPTSNCTHWLDLTVLAIGQAARGATPVRQYDVEVTDEVDGVACARVWRDGELVHDWRTGDFVLSAPAHLAGNTLFRGFAAWASQAFAGDEQEAAFVLQKGYFVAQARRFDVDAAAGRLAADHGMGQVCFSYSAGNAERARRQPHTVRDFTDTPEQLLRFL